jgi:glycosyltransferase involved in cell wall biosynthesis
MEKEIQGMTGSRINIMILIVSMPVGGVENQILSIVQELKKQKYNITICCIKEKGVLGEKAEESGIRTVALNLMKSNRFSLNIPYQISRFFKENHIHILWTHQYVANLYGRMASIASRTPVVISSFHALYDKPKIHRRFFNHLLSYRTDALIAVSNAVASDVKSYDHVNSSKVKVIHNGADLPFFDIPESKAECRAKLGLPEDDIIIGSVGRLSEEKNHKVIVEAIKSLPANVKGLIVGDGPLENALKEAGGNRVYLFTNMQHSLLPLALKAMDVFCFPSLWEGFGLALVEAMAAGLPVVASDIPTLREVAHDAAIFCRSNNAGELSNILKSLINDPALMKSMGKKSVKRAEHFSIDNMVRAYEDIFNEIIRKKNVVNAI